jgi:uncharacterized protein YwqG
MGFILATILVLGAVAVYLVMCRDGNNTPLADEPQRMPEPFATNPAALEELSFEAIAARPSAQAGGSYLGGAPPRSTAYSWPLRKGKPLAFLACIDLTEVPVAAGLDWLPRTGLLLFFYDTDKQPWGFDPADRGGSATIHLPDVTKVEAGSSATPPAPLPKDAVFLKRPLSFHQVKLPPEASDPRLRDLSDEAMDALETARARIFGDHPHHQIGGLPEPIQDAGMDLEAQLVTHGLFCGDPSGYKDPRAKELRPGAADWSLLLQIDSDDDAKMMWGDAGMLYFWIRREDARQGKFDNSWVILQCG